MTTTEPQILPLVLGIGTEEGAAVMSLLFVAFYLNYALLERVRLSESPCKRYDIECVSAKLEHSIYVDVAPGARLLSKKKNATQTQY